MNLTDQARAFFLAHPHQPIKHTELARRFGIGGYRTRCSEIRRWYGMDIRVRQIAVKRKDGSYVQQALYTYVPKSKQTRKAA